MKAKQETINKLTNLVLDSEAELKRPPITLERVLRAIKKYSWEFVDAYPLPIIRFKALPEIKISWTLTLPAHEQEEETLQALIDILTPVK